MSWRLAVAVLRYRAAVAAKRVAGLAFDLLHRRSPRRGPSVTIFLTTSNNRLPLELTLRTMLSKTRYQPYQVVVADNGSTDGSLEWLSALSQHVPLRTLHGARAQSEWYDLMFREADTDYWVALHEDLIFTGRDWLADLIARMEADPELQLLEGEYFAPKLGMVEPVSNELINLEESLATWLFCVRTSLREHLPDASFRFHKGPDPSKGVLRSCYDIGGRLLAEMREAELKYGWMPRWYKMKWHHVGNLSWIGIHASPGVHADLKRYQRCDIARRVRKRA